MTSASWWWPGAAFLAALNQSPEALLGMGMRAVPIVLMVLAFWLVRRDQQRLKAELDALDPRSLARMDAMREKAS